MVFTRDLNPKTLRQMTDGYRRQHRRFQSPEQTENKKKTRIKMAVGSFLFCDIASTYLERRLSEKYSSSEIHYLQYSAGYFYRFSMFLSRKPIGVDDFVSTCCGTVRVYLFKLFRQTYTLDKPTHYKSQEN